MWMGSSCLVIMCCIIGCVVYDHSQPESERKKKKKYWANYGGKDAIV
jgi:hypothetical protein